MHIKGKFIKNKGSKTHMSGRNSFQAYKRQIQQKVRREKAHEGEGKGSLAYEQNLDKEPVFRKCVGQVINVITL